MKQRLLLVLLALFTSIGWMNAGIALKVPQGATGSLTISKVTTGEIQEPITINGQTISSNSYTYKIDDIAKNNDATITLGGSIKSLSSLVAKFNILIFSQKKLNGFHETCT